MELIVSAIAGDLANRFVSFLIKRYRSEEDLEGQMERLQRLLIRVHMIVKEAEARYITNSNMLFQLKKFVEVMYRGYHIMDTIKYRTLHSSRIEKEVSIFNDLSFTTSTSQHSSKRRSSISHDLQRTLDDLESVVSDSKEFVLFLGGCERLFRRPYDSYIYIDNFMFGRQVEKQQIINILLQDDPPSGPTVLPVIGGGRVGKKTLVAHVCRDDKVRSHFSRILHLNGENIGSTEHRPAITGRALVVVEFSSDVDDENWLKFYSSAKQMGKGCKIVIISRMSKISRFGTVRPIHVNSLSQDEYSYFFKVLAFGSTNPEEQPQLASIAKDLSVALGGSLVTANVYAYMLRKNQNVRFWLSILKKYWKMVENNITVFGEHPKDLMDKGHPVDITRLASSSAILLLMPPHSETDDSKRELPKVPFADLFADTAVLPKEFELVSGETRIPPYKRFVNLVTYCDNDKISRNHTESPSNKRQRLDK
ncbi:hypothetical protein U9M48_042096 [Paspalum notatum var. saurae]|uniref:Disease resistance N-terminal domain-containing protein n=1 Tax=Paspalum notatum var. saurae TaxID=547442 RepID=A0AAQ3US43_PASNO